MQTNPWNTEKTLETPADVARFLDVELPKVHDLKLLNQLLTQRVYKDTACGAWAEVVQDDQLAMASQRWSGVYERLDDGYWRLVRVERVGKPHPRDLDRVEEYVHEFFAIGSDDTEVQDRLFAAAGEATLCTLTETLEVPIRPPEAFVFRCGAGIEGIDQTTTVQVVTLPCSEAEVRAAVDAVESEADELWAQTHGCDGCGPENEIGYRSIDPDCAACTGLGVIL